MHSIPESQRQIVETLESLGLDGVSLLEVGCGVGILHQTLLEKGAATALGVDLAPRIQSRFQDVAHSGIRGRLNNELLNRSLIGSWTESKQKRRFCGCSNGYVLSKLD